MGAASSTYGTLNMALYVKHQNVLTWQTVRNIIHEAFRAQKQYTQQGSLIAQKDEEYLDYLHRNR